MSDYAITRGKCPGKVRAKSWRETSHEAISAALITGADLGLTGRKLELHVSRTGYPFSVRRGYMYQVWLDAFHRRLRRYQGPMDYRARQRRLLARISRGQGELFHTKEASHA